MKGMDILAMAGKKPLPESSGSSSNADLDVAVKELFANPSAATFKAAMDLCNMADYDDTNEESAE